LIADNISTGIAVVKANVGNLAVVDPILAKYAAEIRRLGKRVKEDVIEIGRYLDQAQQHAGHGTWLTWIEAEFGWSDQTARRFIHIYELSRDSKFNKLLSSNLPLSALYQLAAPKTPEAARKAITERVEAGGKVSVAAVTKVIAKAKGKTNTQTTKPAGDKLGAGSGEIFTIVSPSVRGATPATSILIDPRSGKTFSFVTDSVGGRRAVGELKDAIMTVWQAQPGVLPVVQLATSSMKTRYGVKPRPDFKIVDWRGGTPLAPAEQAENAEPFGVPFDDEIPWK
jgi:hypothetical protein